MEGQVHCAEGHVGWLSLRSVVGLGDKKNCPITQKNLFVFLLPVGETMFIFLTMQEHQAVWLGLGSQL